MAALDWQSRVTTLNAMVLTSPADKQNRDATVWGLTHSGGQYDTAYAHFGASAVNGSKAAGDAAFATATTTWQTQTQPVHDNADRFGRFVVGGTAIPFAPDGSAQGALTARLSDAEKALNDPGHAKTSLKEELDVHDRAVSAAYGKRPTAPYYTGVYAERTPLLGTSPKTGKHYSIHEFETQVLGPKIAEADLLIEELTFA